MELPFLTVNYDTLISDNFTTLHYTTLHYSKPAVWVEQCYHPTEREIKKIPLLFYLPSYIKETKKWILVL
jgi:hypothetical protein